MECSTGKLLGQCWAYQTVVKKVNMKVKQKVGSLADMKENMTEIELDKWSDD